MCPTLKLFLVTQSFIDDINDSRLSQGKCFNNSIYLPDQSDSELSVDFIRMVTVRSPERMSGSEAEQEINTFCLFCRFSDWPSKAVGQRTRLNAPLYSAVYKYWPFSSAAISLHVVSVFNKLTQAENTHRVSDSLAEGEENGWGWLSVLGRQSPEKPEQRWLRYVNGGPPWEQVHSYSF